MFLARESFKKLVESFLKLAVLGEAGEAGNEGRAEKTGFFFRGRAAAHDGAVSDESLQPHSGEVRRTHLVIKNFVHQVGKAGVSALEFTDVGCGEEERETAEIIGAKQSNKVVSSLKVIENTGLMGVFRGWVINCRHVCSELFPIQMRARGRVHLCQIESHVAFHTSMPLKSLRRVPAHLGKAERAERVARLTALLRQAGEDEDALRAALRVILIINAESDAAPRWAPESQRVLRDAALDPAWVGALCAAARGLRVAGESVSETILLHARLGGWLAGGASEAAAALQAALTAAGRPLSAKTMSTLLWQAAGFGDPESAAVVLSWQPAAFADATAVRKALEHACEVQTAHALARAGGFTAPPGAAEKFDYPGVIALLKVWLIHAGRPLRAA